MGPLLSLEALLSAWLPMAPFLWVVLLVLVVGDGDVDGVLGEPVEVDGVLEAIGDSGGDLVLGGVGSRCRSPDLDGELGDGVLLVGCGELGRWV